MLETNQHIPYYVQIKTYLRNQMCIRDRIDTQGKVAEAYFVAQFVYRGVHVRFLLFNWKINRLSTSTSPLVMY